MYCDCFAVVTVSWLFGHLRGLACFDLLVGVWLLVVVNLVFWG